MRQESPKIIQLTKKVLVGRSLRMSMHSDRTAELWRELMSEHARVVKGSISKLYSLQVYDEPFDISDFDSETEFTKHALMESSSFTDIPTDLKAYELKGGLYAMFIHRGPAADFHQTMDYIFDQWLPNSEYDVDHRPHFERFDVSYDPLDTTSQEEVWIPIIKV